MLKKKTKRKRRYVGKYPVNSRITIDYSKKKPNVKFNYPKKKPEDVRNQVIYSIPVVYGGVIITIFIMLILQGVAYDFIPSPDDFKNFIYVIILTFIYFLSMFILYLFYTKTKFGNRIFPELNKMIVPKYSRYYVKMNKTKVSKDKTIELPLFKNVFLDYKASKDFSKQLLRMEIREHPFDKINRKGKKEKGQVFLWKATFYFKQIPKDGNLEIWWN